MLMVSLLYTSESDSMNPWTWFFCMNIQLLFILGKLILFVVRDSVKFLWSSAFLIYNAQNCELTLVLGDYLVYQSYSRYSAQALGSGQFNNDIH